MFQPEKEIVVKFSSSVFSALFDPNEFFYQRARRKYREAIVRGEKTRMPVLDFSGGGKIRVDPRDIVATQKFEGQCEAIRHIRALWRATSQS